MDVTLNVTLAAVQLSTRENVTGKALDFPPEGRRTRNECRCVECCVQVRRSRWMGHDEAPFLDGRGLRVGLAEPMV